MTRVQNQIEAHKTDVTCTPLIRVDQDCQTAPPYCTAYRRSTSQCVQQYGYYVSYSCTIDSYRPTYPEIRDCRMEQHHVPGHHRLNIKQHTVDITSKKLYILFFGSGYEANWGPNNPEITRDRHAMLHTILWKHDERCTMY